MRVFLLPNLLAAAMVAFQIMRSFKEMDMHSNDFILRYAKAIAQSMPKNSLWLTNYDQQWTSFRYLQACEDFRPDITFLSVSSIELGQALCEIEHARAPRAVTEKCTRTSHLDTNKSSPS